MKKINSILDYWYYMEFFAPFWPEKNADSFFSKNFDGHMKPLPWFKDNAVPKNVNKMYSYDVFVGEAQCNDLILQMLTVLDLVDDTVEKYTTKCVLFSFKATQDGQYVPGSLCISSLIWAVCQIIKEKRLRASLGPEALKQFTQSIDENITELFSSLDCSVNMNYAQITTIQKTIGDFLELAPANITDLIICNPHLVDIEKNTSESSLDSAPPESNMLSSFYVNDIFTIRSSIHHSDPLTKYITSLSTNKDTIFEIDREVAAMQLFLQPQHYPMGKWPSKHSPCLMQQLAINLAIEPIYDHTIFSVNGPPGTGKTTLLKEIIASNIVDRAVLFSDYKKPDDAFSKRTFSEPTKFFDCYYVPAGKLTDYGMLVASNNNAAVENISRELPQANRTTQSECNTDLFDISSREDIYFTDIANLLSHEDGSNMWGLISARLGKKSNINELNKALLLGKPNTFDQLFEGDIPDWETAKKSFKKKYKQVQKEREKIADGIAKISQLKTYTRDIHDLQLQLNQLQSSINQARTIVSEETNHVAQMKNKCNSMEDEYYDANAQAVRLDESINYYTEGLPFLHRKFPSFFKNSEKLVHLQMVKKEKANLNLLLNSKEQCLQEYKVLVNHQTNKVQEAQSQLSRIQSEADQVETEIINLQIKLNSCKNQLISLQNRFGSNFADDTFWFDIPHNKASQLACPWTDKVYDTLREELFYEALSLQKAFILNSKCVRKNIQCLVNIWRNFFNKKDKQASYAPLLNTLFFVVPVISTTFASVSTFLDGIGKQELGILIIDEAGQATPQSALGALWRTRKAIVVGDPLQVEPIVTVPEELRKRFCEEYKLDTDYRVKELSVQSLADAMNSFGGYREYDGSRLWLGCPLVVHRRCLDPMFSISNAIAYNNRMFQQTSPPKDNIWLSRPESCWIDVKGIENGGKDHFVQSQCTIVLELVQRAVENASGTLPNLYIISPFTTVIYGLKPQLETLLKRCIPGITKAEIYAWLSASCGTVHTFQGKEANEVLLVLGCDNKSGFGAASWAGSKPNILNVAVSRAKYRLTIIGDKHLWKTVPYFGTALEMLSQNEN